jgi:hypothetical protein
MRDETLKQALRMRDQGFGKATWGEQFLEYLTSITYQRRHDVGE